MIVNAKAVERGVYSSMSKYAEDPRSELCFLDPKKMNFRRDSHFIKARSLSVYVFKQDVSMVWHCKVKSSDDIIINVLETDGRSLCFGLCFHSI